MTVLKSLLGRYRTELSNYLEGIKRMFRTREEREMGENNKDLNNEKDTLFRSSEFTSSLTVPVSPDGILAKKVRKNLREQRQRG